MNRQELLQERFRSLVHEHGGLIAMICREAFREEEYHQQALRQRILERLWHNMPRVPALVVDWKRWIWRVALNERGAYLRSKEYRDSHRWARLEGWMEGPTPEEDALRQRLEWLLSQLDERDRTLAHHLLDGKPRAELTEIYRCSLPTIDRRIAELKLKLRTLHEQNL